MEQCLSNTYAIGRKAGTTILHSARTAESIGRPFTKMVTINFWQFGSTADTIFRDFADLRSDWFCRWSKRPITRKKLVITPPNGVPTYAYVHEDPSGKRPHTHWLVHITPENEERFLKALRDRLKLQFGLDDIPTDALHVSDVYNAEGAKLYLTKGLQKKFALLWNIEPVVCGRIAYRRADCSRNIGPSVWQPLKEQYRRGWKQAA
jgi:hypothetical protein